MRRRLKMRQKALAAPGAGGATEVLMGGIVSCRTAARAGVRRNRTGADESGCAGHRARHTARFSAGRGSGRMRIDVGGGVRLFVDVEGPGLVPDGPRLREKPTLICMHGGPGFDHAAFKPGFSRLADLAQIVYYDHRGHGRSDARPSSEWNLDTWADDIVRLSDALGIAKPIVLGQSFGGFVAQRYIERHPAHASKVILSSTSHHMGMERKLAMFEQRGGPQARELARAFWTH